MKGVAYLLVMMALLIVFLPKINLYYAAEKLMAKQSISISDETLSDTGVSFHIENARVLFDKLLVAQVQKISLNPWLFYSSVRIDGIRVNEAFADFLPAEIQKVELKHWIFNPLHLTLRAQSEEGFFYGDVDLLKRSLQIHLRLDKAGEKKYQAMLGRLISEEGGYRYEYQF